MYRVTDKVVAYYKNSRQRVASSLPTPLEYVIKNWRDKMPFDVATRTPEEQLTMLNIASINYTFRWAEERYQTRFEL